MEESVLQCVWEANSHCHPGAKPGCRLLPACVPDLSARSGDKKRLADWGELLFAGLRGGVHSGADAGIHGASCCVHPQPFVKVACRAQDMTLPVANPQSKECSEKRPPLKDFRPVTLNFCPCASIYSGDDNIQTSHLKTSLHFKRWRKLGRTVSVYWFAKKVVLVFPYHLTEEPK